MKPAPFREKKRPREEMAPKGNGGVSAPKV